MVFPFLLYLRFLNLFFQSANPDPPFLVPPVRVSGYRDIELTPIGAFGVLRKERPGIPAHLHTGVDIRRPTDNYLYEPIFPVMRGIVISTRDDGPYAQVIIEHRLPDLTFWTVYEHVAGIRVSLHEEVSPGTAIARFFTSEELNLYGWQFDHFHLEILKVCPQKMEPTTTHPGRLFRSYTLQCFTLSELASRFMDPLQFLSGQL